MGWSLLVVLALFGLCRADPELNCDNATLHLVPACLQGCPPEHTCQNFRGPEPPCVPPTAPCKPQCVCADGYARNQYGGTCVTLEQCDKCPGNNQYFACDGPYSETCPGSCHCTSGYARDANNCVSTTPPPVDTHPSPPPPPSRPIQEPIDWPPQPEVTCDNATLHQIAVCTHGCPPEKTCQNRNWPPFPCAPPAFPCTPRCVCDDGYARNKPDGTCVTLEQCDECPGENEYFQCDCEYDEDCVGRCYCFSNHVRDIDGKCVYVDPAEPPVKKPQGTEPICDSTIHEVLGCVWPCPPEHTCQSIHDPEQTCQPADPWTCTAQCVCSRGYARNLPGGPCVTVQQCDKCRIKTEYFACDGPYHDNCTGSCHCLAGYERDANNICVSTTPTPPPVVYHPPPPPPPSSPQPSQPGYPVCAPIQPVHPVQSVQPVELDQVDDPFEFAIFYNL